MKLRESVAHALDEHASDGWITTGWILIAAAEQPGDGTCEHGYAYTIPEGQPIHVTRGLIEMARLTCNPKAAG